MGCFRSCYIRRSEPKTPQVLETWRFSLSYHQLNSAPTPKSVLKEVFYEY